MSSQHTVGHAARHGRAPVRVRDRAREAVAVMAFSAATSSCLAVGLIMLSQLGR